MSRTTPASRNVFHDLHHETERTIARTKQACRELENYMDAGPLQPGRLKKRRIAERDAARRLPERRPH